MKIAFLDFFLFFPLFVDSPLADIMTISKFWPTGGLVLLGF